MKYLFDTVFAFVTHFVGSSSNSDGHRP